MPLDYSFSCLPCCRLRLLFLREGEVDGSGRGFGSGCYSLPQPTPWEEFSGFSPFPPEHLVEFWEKNLQAGITSLCLQFPGMSHSHTSPNQVLASCEQLLAESFYTFMWHQVTCAQVSKCSDSIFSYRHPSLSRFQGSCLPCKLSFLVGSRKAIHFQCIWIFLL